MEFHHVGIACRAVDAEVENWRPLGYAIEGEAFADPIQGVRGLFMTGAGCRIELLEQLDGSTVLEPFLKRGILAYHHAYLTDSLHQQIDHLEDLGARLVVEPVPAVAFDGREIAFLSLRNGFLCELIEKARDE